MFSQSLPRPNIFRTREKHIRYPMYGVGSSPPTTQYLEEADWFTIADIEGLQADIKKRMRAKTE